MVMVVTKEGNRWVIIHAGRVIDETFQSEREAEKWADGNIDDQMFDGPNCLAPPLRYRTAPLLRVHGDE